MVEATGSACRIRDCVATCPSLGYTGAQKHLCRQIDDFDVSQLVVDEITIVGSRCGPFPRAVAALAERHVDVRPLVAARYSLRDGQAAFARAQAKGVLKVLMDPRLGKGIVALSPHSG